MTGLVILYAACRSLMNHRGWRWWCLLMLVSSPAVAQTVSAPLPGTGDHAARPQGMVTLRSQSPAGSEARWTSARTDAAAVSFEAAPFPTQATTSGAVNSEGVIRLSASPTTTTVQTGDRFRQPAPADRAGAAIQPVAYDPTLVRPAVSADGVIRHVSHPRVGGPCPQCGPGGPCPSCGPGYAGHASAHPPVIVGGPGIVAWDPTHYPDEYLCDGGDRGAPFHYQGRELGGLETEDTIADAYDVTGKRIVVPSTRVCIYAPRFGALRTITGTQLARDTMRAAGANEKVRVAGINTQLNPDTQVQQDRLQQFAMRSRPSSADANARESGLQRDLLAHQSQQQLAVFQNLTFLSEGQFQQSDLPILAYGAQCAGAWTRDQNPVMVGRNQRGMEVEVEFNVHEFVGTEDRRTAPLLRVVKLADRETARPGDVIKFTLRFDNLGQRELFEVRIIDNLTPRLEYIAGSATCELAGGLDIVPNGEGSSVLTFRLDEPLNGETGGVITFECRVR